MIVPLGTILVVRTEVRIINVGLYLRVVVRYETPSDKGVILFLWCKVTSFTEEVHDHFFRARALTGDGLEYLN